MMGVACLAPPLTLAQQPGQLAQAHSQRALSGIPDNDPTPRNEALQALSDKQKHAIVHANLERAKSDAAELAAMAKEVCAELEKPNVTARSVEVVERLEKIDKLAKKIRDETKGY
jgi:hypothetical protein